MGSKEREMTLEEAFSVLEETVTKLESDEISLEESFKAYQYGMEILKLCNHKIDKVEKEVLKINENGETYEF